MQNLQGTDWTAADVEHHVRSRLETAFADVWELACDRRLSLRRAAYVLAVQRTAEAMRLRGFSP
jgi:glutamate dehydrogenase